MAKQINISLGKLKETIFNFIELSPSPEEIENANEILCEQNFRVIEIHNTVENYLETLSKSSEVCSSKVSKSARNIFTVK